MYTLLIEMRIFLLFTMSYKYILQMAQGLHIKKQLQKT